MAKMAEKWSVILVYTADERIAVGMDQDCCTDEQDIIVARGLTEDEAAKKCEEYAKQTDTPLFGVDTTDESFGTVTNRAELTPAQVSKLAELKPEDIDRALSLMRCEETYKENMRKRALLGDGYMLFALRHTLYWHGKDKMAILKQRMGVQ
jgi:hypothetical protein